MGYYITYMEDNFKILKANHDKALAAIKGLAGRETIVGYGGEPHFSWVHIKEFVEARHIEDAFQAWRWEVNFSDVGDIQGIYFTGEKWGDDEVLFGAIAPFVVDDSYIQMRGEEGEIWRWVFKDGELLTFNAELSFPKSRGCE